MTSDLDVEQMTRSWKYKAEATAKGIRITVHGDDIDQVVNDYSLLKAKLTAAGHNVAPEY